MTTPRLLAVLLMVFGVCLPSAWAEQPADVGLRPVRWWEDGAVAAPPAEHVARYSILCELSEDQFAAWFAAFDVHLAAVDALVEDAKAIGPVVLRDDDDERTSLGRQIEIRSRLSRLRRSMEPLRDQLLAALLEPLTDDQRERAIAWRNLVLLDEDLMAWELQSGPIEFAALEETLADMRMSRDESDRLGAILSASADSRRAMAVELGVRDGGFRALMLRGTAAAREAGTPWPDVNAAVATDPSPEIRDRLQTMERYRTVVLGVVEDLDGLGLSRSIVDEARARILARADPFLTTPASVIVGAARLLATDLPDAERAELERLNGVALRGLLDHVRTGPTRFWFRSGATTPEDDAAWEARFVALQSLVPPLSERVAVLGGSIPQLASSVPTLMGPYDAGATGGGGGHGDGATIAVAVALAPDLGWTGAEARERAVQIAGGRRVREVGAVVDTQRAALAVDLLQAVADGASRIAAARDPWSERRGSHFVAVSPDRRWGNAPLTAWVLAAATADERTSERLQRLLEFERARLARMRTFEAAEREAGPLDWEDSAAVNDRLNALRQESAARRALTNAALAEVTGNRPRLAAAVHDAIDGHRIPWLLAQHREMETRLAGVEADMRLGPARRLALIHAGDDVRALARQVDLWLGRLPEPGGLLPGDGPGARVYATAQRVWTRRAFAVEVIRRRQELLAR